MWLAILLILFLPNLFNTIGDKMFFLFLLVALLGLLTGGSLFIFVILTFILIGVGATWDRELRPRGYRK